MSCTPDDDNNRLPGNNIPPAIINFFNESSFKVDIFKNFNPDYFDITTLVCSVNPGSTVRVEMPPSSDSVFGDTFYLRYKVLLANALETGTANIFVDAQRDLSNISFVVESGRIYTRTIPQPPPSKLRFVNGYVKIQNMSSAQVRISRGNNVLQKLDDNGVFLSAGSNMGYYEIQFPLYATNSFNVTDLRAFSSSYLNFPNFIMERGKLYSFTINNTEIIGPVITNINPVAN
jgi:hypothetical protein